jgi:hypothetical protein
MVWELVDASVISGGAVATGANGGLLDSRCADAECPGNDCCCSIATGALGGIGAC